MTVAGPFRHLPIPDRYRGADACRFCSGRRVTGTRYTVRPDPARPPIAVEELCPVCDGCGRGLTHTGCRPIEHGGWDPSLLYDDTEMGDCCPSCFDRRWISVAAGSDHTFTYLMVPCGLCAEPLLETLPDRPKGTPR